MPKKNIDEEFNSIFEAIDITIDGVEYSVKKIESNLLESMREDATNPARMREIFARLVGVDAKAFVKTDFRKIACAMRFINESMGEQLEGFRAKNASGESVGQKA